MSLLPDAHREFLQKALPVWLKGNQHAVTLCFLFFEIAHTWDDLVDQDSPITVDHIHKAFRFSTIDINLNPFWVQNASMLLPVLMLVQQQWICATQFEKEKIELEKCFVLRALIHQLIIACASCIGGYDWGIQVAREVWLSYKEKFDDYSNEVKNA